MSLWGFFFFSSRRRHTRCGRDWSSDVCSSDLGDAGGGLVVGVPARLAYGQRGQAEAERGVGGGEQERGGPQPVVGGQGPGGHGGAGERGVAGGFVESHREATASRTGLRP